MNYVLVFCFSLALIVGIINGLGELAKVKRYPELGYKPSKNLFTFLFSDKY